MEGVLGFLRKFEHDGMEGVLDFLRKFEHLQHAAR